MTDISKQTEDKLKAIIASAQLELERQVVEYRVVNLTSVRGFNTRVTFRTNANGLVSWSIAVGSGASDLTPAEAKILQNCLNDILGKPEPC